MSVILFCVVQFKTKFWHWVEWDEATLAIVPAFLSVFFFWFWCRRLLLLLTPPPPSRIWACGCCSGSRSPRGLDLCLLVADPAGPGRVCLFPHLWELPQEMAMECCIQAALWVILPGTVALIGERLMTAGRWGDNLLCCALWVWPQAGPSLRHSLEVVHVFAVRVHGPLSPQHVAVVERDAQQVVAEFCCPLLCLPGEGVIGRILVELIHTCKIVEQYMSVKTIKWSTAQIQSNTQPKMNIQKKEKGALSVLFDCANCILHMMMSLYLLWSVCCLFSVMFSTLVSHCLCVNVLNK